ncbi:hypothetical protein RRG08_045544, partial [Elysia crispata]
MTTGAATAATTVGKGAVQMRLRAITRTADLTSAASADTDDASNAFTMGLTRQYGVPDGLTATAYDKTGCNADATHGAMTQ